MSSHESLSAAANDRKARLAHLKNLKRKQAPADDSAEAPSDLSGESTALVRPASPPTDPVTKTYLSGRNFDHESRNVKLGFESTPVADKTSTLEYKAEQLALASKAKQDAENAEDKPLDLFKLQPKKPNWDLKRDLGERMRGLDIQTDNAIARLVRERVEAQRKDRSAEKDNGKKIEAGEEVGMEGSELVEAMHLKEQEEEKERRRNEEEENEDVS